MAAVNISPVLNQTTFLKNDGTPASGYKIFAYEAGSFSALKDTYTSEAGDTLNTNPLVLNSVGQLDEVAIWLIAGETYNLVYTQDDGTTVIKNFDDVAGVLTSTGSSGNGISVWNATAASSYLSPTQFLTVGNFAADFAIGNRVRVTQDGGFAYGTVTAVSFSDPNTHVTLELDAGSFLDGTLSAAEWSSLIANGRTVDAGGVSYSVATQAYSTVGTVGNELRTMLATEASLQAQITALAATVAAAVSVPIGGVVAWPNAVAPANWLECNGAAFSGGTYPALATILGGTTLPDLRGEFIRGWDNGRGVDPARTLGSSQADQMQQIVGFIGTDDRIAGGGPNGACAGAFKDNTTTRTAGLAAGVPDIDTTAEGGDGVCIIAEFNSAWSTVAGGARTGTETRPVSVALMYIVRAL